MGRVQTTITTSLTVEQCAALFKSTAEGPGGLGSKLAGVSAKLTGNDAVSFYTPTDDSPFADFEDMPAFLVGCRKARMGSGGAAGNMTDVQMEVYDRGIQREVVLISEFKLGGGRHAKDMIRRVGQAFASADR